MSMRAMTDHQRLQIYWRDCLCKLHDKAVVSQETERTCEEKFLQIAFLDISKAYKIASMIKKFLHICTGLYKRLVLRQVLR